MRNERGFIMPLVAILAFLFAAIILHQIELLENDRRFFQERKNYFIHDSHLQTASIEVLSILQKSDTIEKIAGQLHFETGSVAYKVTANNKTIATIQLTSTTHIPGKRVAIVEYNKETKQIDTWTE